MIVYKVLIELVYNQNIEYGNDLLPWCRQLYSTLSDTGRELGTEIRELDNVLSSNGLWFD